MISFKPEALIPSSLNDPERFARTAERHRNALAWKPQGWIPLGIIVNNPDNLQGLSYDRWEDPEAFYVPQAKLLRDTLTVGSDYMPVMAINHLGDVLIPTMLGAELFVPTEMAGSVQDTGATPRPVLNDIAGVDDLAMPDITAGHMPQHLEIIRRWREWAPPWVHIVTPFPLAPFSLAAELRGSGFFLDIIDEPARCHRFLALCAEMQIRGEQCFREAIGAAGGPALSNFGVLNPGRRLGDDYVINLSPEQITEFAVPHIETVARQLGPSNIHFCTLPEHRADHVFEPLARSEWISTASSQFSFEYYETHLDELRGRLSLEAFYGQGYEYVCEKFGSFRDWAFDFVPKFKNDSGLVLFFEVPSVDAGREVWDIWHTAHAR